MFVNEVTWGGGGGGVVTFAHCSPCVSLFRCSRQYRGEDATSGVCPEQEESLGSAKFEPLSAQ